MFSVGSASFEGSRLPGFHAGLELYSEKYSEQLRLFAAAGASPSCSATTVATVEE